MSTRYRQASLTEHPYVRKRAQEHVRKIRDVIRILNTDEYAGLRDADDAIHALQRLADEIENWDILHEPGIVERTIRRFRRD